VQRPGTRHDFTAARDVDLGRVLDDDHDRLGASPLDCGIMVGLEDLVLIDLVIAHEAGSGIGFRPPLACGGESEGRLPGHAFEHLGEPLVESLITEPRRSRLREDPIVHPGHPYNRTERGTPAATTATLTLQAPDRTLQQKCCYVLTLTCPERQNLWRTMRADAPG